MPLVLGKTEAELEKKTTDIEGVGENDWSKLMYYINCIATVLRMDDADINRLRQFKKFRTLTSQDKDQILIFCTLLAPEVLEDKCIFQKDALCIKYLNEFYDLKKASTVLAVSDDILIGGSRKTVQKIMCYTKFWLKDNYTDPYNAIVAARQARRETASRPVHSIGGPAREASGNAASSGGGSSADQKEKEGFCNIQ